MCDVYAHSLESTSVDPSLQHCALVDYSIYEAAKLFFYGFKN